ncbi:unnamed protein product [Cladocopium goreaui]|uniref:Selenoprotein O n=1 Tax=Cladocopium goreaui TaxID=2562237 RepID=A0A9P1M4V3_9DINO|nr:unnamed protein product [Cladocopium goreaui]
MSRAGNLCCLVILFLTLPRLQRPLLLPRQFGHGYGRTALRAEEVKSGPSPEAWREFRAQLIARESQEAQNRQNRSRVQRVAPKNEALLRAQSEDLWNEYMSGAWAHVVPVEVGGLLCRSPLPAQLTWLMRKDADFIWAKKLRKLLEEELPEIDGRPRKELFQAWSKNTMFCYRLADRLTNEALTKIVQKNLRSLNMEDKELIVLYGDMESTWQSVCLVLGVDSADMVTEAVAINRPFSRSVDEQLARLLLFGEKKNELHPKEQMLLQGCLAAFGEAAVYFGGPHDLNNPGLLVHGFSDLMGAEEIAPGTRIYKGGVEAAIDAIRAGRKHPLDFRWFLGRHKDLSTQDFSWVSVACARPVALKQCLGLPKPLWHEVMELCGGEHAELSSVELRKRKEYEDEDEPDEDSRSE